MERQITLSEVVQAGLDALRNDMHHAMPGAVVSYDETQETADIQPGTNDARFDADSGQRISEPWPVLKGVPVAWPRFGGFVIKGSLAQFDPVVLVAFDMDPTPWRAGGRSLKPVDPGDVRRHGGGYWFAFPTNLLLSRAPHPTQTGTLTIGAEGQAPVIEITGTSIRFGSGTGADAMALASKVDAVFNGLLQQLAAIGTSPLTGTSLNAALAACWAGTPAAPGALPTTTASSLVKAQ